MTAVMGFDGGCWATRVTGKATKTNAALENLIRPAKEKGNGQLTDTGNAALDLLKGAVRLPQH